MSKEIGGFAETMTGLINTFNELSAESHEITTSLDSLKDQSTAVKTSYAEMLSMTNKLRGAMQELTVLSQNKQTV
jgi:methyl-accepting chemotaxis protein